MFVGHYGPGLAIRAIRPAIPLWVLFIAVQLIDIAWAVFVLAGIEKLRIVPGFAGLNPLDLYFIPYTHGLITALLWSLLAGVCCKLAFRWPTWTLAAWVGAAVFSHWLLDLLVHRPDLPVYGNSMKVGLGLWQFPMISFALEVAIVVSCLWLYLRGTVARNAVGRYGPGVFVLLMLMAQLATMLGPPPPSTSAIASSALAAYLLFAFIAGWLDQQRSPRTGVRSPHG